MLNSFKERLQKLVIDPDDQFTKHLRKRVGKRATKVLEKRLKQLTLLMPGIVGRTYDLWARTRTPLRAKKLGGLLLAYMYHPKDFFPEDVYGLFGYLDDAYFAASVYEQVCGEMKKAGLPLAIFDEDLLSDLQGLKRAVRIVIPKEIEKIDQVIHEAAYEEHGTFLKMFGSS